MKRFNAYEQVQAFKLGTLSYSMATLLEGSKIEEKKLQEIIASAIDRALINGTCMYDLKRLTSEFRENQQLLRLYYPKVLLFFV